MHSNILDEAIDMRSIIVPSHELQYLLTRVLEWDIKIGEEVLQLLELLPFLAGGRLGCR